MTTPFRVEPKLPAHAYTTYALSKPAGTHYRAATCAEVECQHSLRGWTTTVDTATPLGARQANYIRLHSGRTFTTQDVSVGGTPAIMIFHFPAGQSCFTAHRVPLEREPLYVVRGGDWRGNPTGERRVHTRGADWVDDMRTTLDTLNTEIAKG